MLTPKNRTKGKRFSKNNPEYRNRFDMCGTVFIKKHGNITVDKLHARFPELCRHHIEEVIIDASHKAWQQQQTLTNQQP